MFLREVKSLSRVQLFGTPWTVVYQAPPSMGFYRQDPTLQVDALPSEPPGKFPYVLIGEAENSNLLQVLWFPTILQPTAAHFYINCLELDLKQRTHRTCLE